MLAHGFVDHSYPTTVEFAKVCEGTNNKMPTGTRICNKSRQGNEKTNLICKNVYQVGNGGAKALTKRML